MYKHLRGNNAKKKTKFEQRTFVHYFFKFQAVFITIEYDLSAFLPFLEHLALAIFPAQLGQA